MRKFNLLKKVGFLLILILAIGISSFPIFDELYRIIGKVAVVLGITLLTWTFILYKLEE